MELFLGYFTLPFQKVGFLALFLMVFLMCSHKGHETKKFGSSTFLFTPNLGEDSRFDSYFSNGLKPATRDRSNPQKLSCLPTIHFSGGQIRCYFQGG